MKNLNMSLFRASIVGVLMFATITSCKKKEAVIPVKPFEKTAVASISDLKKYYGELHRLDTSKISYDLNLKKFLIDGKEQISYEELKQSFLKDPIVNYKDGVPVVE